MSLVPGRGRTMVMAIPRGGVDPGNGEGRVAPGC
jgi:hypothetical protein